MRTVGIDPDELPMTFTELGLADAIANAMYAEWPDGGLPDNYREYAALLAATIFLGAIIEHRGLA